MILAKSFSKLCFSIDGAPDISIVIAACRAGSIGVVSARTKQDLAALPQRIETLSDPQRGARGAFGIRVTHFDAEMIAQIEAWSKGGLAYVVVSQDGLDNYLAEPEAELPQGVSVLAEITGRVASPWFDRVDGLLITGNEAAGFVGEESSFILFQYWIARTNLPLFVNGGVTPQVAAALAAMGAAGGAFDSQLLLLKEAGLPKPVQDMLKNLSGSETVAAGDPGAGAYLRILQHPRAKAAAAFLDVHMLADIAEIHGALDAQPLGLEDPATQLFCLGHDVALTAEYGKRYGSVAKFLKAVDKAVAEQPVQAAKHQPIARQNAFAQAYDIDVPIVQGPMTRVSDSADFAVAVSEGGALPTLAIAMMRPEQVKTLIAETKAKIGNGKWGAGFLGFLPQAMFQAQMEVVLANAPDFAIIAGGRPDQAAKLEEIGVPCFLHLPSAKLLNYYIENGSRRFIFEGRECGGHVGPMSSFVLWSAMIDRICEEIDAGSVKGEELDCLFAGGLHDAFSSAFLQILVAPLAVRGVRVGMIIGTAYVLTNEITGSGAILPKYQEIVRDIEDTAVLASGPGHASRSMRTPFVDTFVDKQKALMTDADVPSEDKREVLDGMIMGTLRVASKGTRRSAETSEIETVSDDEQFDTGMYMIGQVASLRNDVRSISDLHKSLTDDAAELLVVPKPEARKAADSRPLDIAIVGMSAALPGAMHKDVFWQNVLSGVDSVDEVPQHRWDWRLYFDADRKAKDKIYSKWGGFLSDMPFEPGDYGITPKSLKSVDPMQLMALKLADEALADSGYTDMDKDTRNKTCVMIGASGGSGDVGLQYNLRAESPRFNGKLKDELAAQLPEWSEDTFAGILINVISGRITNRLDLGGPNYTTDAACASSLAAVYQAANELRNGGSRMAIAGGVDTQQSPFGFMCFAQTQALSPRGRSRSFDKSADGIAISEGIVMLVMKRLEDAEADGDRIYAVLKGVGSSSDGKGKALNAPEASGQLLAMQRAYEQAGYTPSDVQLYEAHGTGTVVGDSTELKSTGMLVAEDNPAPRRAVIGSVKTNIGHTKATAGIAGLAKVTMALHHKVLPPHRGVDDPNDVLANDDAPLYLLDAPQPWVVPEGTVRRGSVSAFGFGGTNFHATVEEYRGEYREALRLNPSKDWPSELLALSGKDKAGLIVAVRKTLQAAERAPALKPRLLAASVTKGFKAEDGARAALVVKSMDEAVEKLGALLAHLENGADLPDGISFRDTPVEGKVAVLFPGQGSQYTFMGRDASVFLPELADALARADTVLQAPLTARYKTPKVLTEFLFPRGCYAPAAHKAAQRALTNTDIAQPALGAVEAGLWSFLSGRLGLKGDMFAGHSYGEFVAHHAAGVLSFDDLMAVSEARGRLIVEKAADSGQELGTMAALSAPRAVADDIAAQVDGIVVANDNSPTQVILSGPEAAVEQAIKIATARDINATPLPVAAAFHSNLMQPARDALGKVIANLDWNVDAAGQVFSNERAAPHGEDVRTAMTDHLVRPVNFVHEVQAMYDAGARIFIEVGPKAVLSKLVRQILKDKAHVSVATDGPNMQLGDLLAALGELVVAGVPLDLEALFARRHCDGVKLSDLEALGQPIAPSKRGWWINGSGVRRAQDPQRTIGLTEEDVQAIELVELREKQQGQVAPHQNELQNGTPPAAVASPQHAKAPDPSTVKMNLLAGTARKGTQMYDNPISGGGGSDSSVSSSFFNMIARVVESAESVALAELQGGGASVVSRGGHKQVRMRPAPQALNVTPAPALTQGGFSEAQTPFTAQVAPVAAPAPAPAPVPQPAMAAAAPAPAPVAEAPAPIAAPAAAPAPAQVDLKTSLLAIVAEKTGYDEDMLEMDQNIEADLGIDSIKRVDIVAGLVKDLPEAISAKLGDDERSALNEAKTLDGMLDILRKVEASVNFNVAGVGKASDQLDAQNDASEVDFLPRPIDARYVVAPRREPLPSDVRSELTAGEFLMVPSGTPLDKALAKALEGAGRKVHMIPQTALANEDALLLWIEENKAGLGALAGLIHLGAMGTDAIDLKAGPDAWRAMLFQSEKAHYMLLRELEFVTGAHAVAITSLGGRFARDLDGAEALKMQAGGVGLLKSLLREDEVRRCKAIDLDPETALKDQIALLMAEISAMGGRVEVGYPKGIRTVFRSEIAPISEKLEEPAHDYKVILATGGARGVTSESIRELGKPGVTFILTGRSALPEPSQTLRDETALAAMSETELAKYFVKHEKMSIGDGRRKAAKVVASREMLDCIAALKETGADVEYVAMDVVDTASVKATMNELYKRFGQIDGIVHGAGVIEDKFLRDIPGDSWSRVVDTKVIGMLTLMQNVRTDSLKFFYCFTSVAGRYGNAGQTSYATANELMARLCSQYQAMLGAQTQVKSMSWGPWGPTTFGAGMVTPETERKFRLQGVYLVHAKLGADLFRQENRLGGTGGVEVVFGAAPWEGAEAGRSKIERTGGGSLLGDAQPEMGVGGKQKLSIAVEAWMPYLQDHIIDGKPVLPMAVAMEMMAEAVEHVFGGDLHLIAVEDAQLFNGIVLEEDTKALVAVLSQNSHGMEEHESVSVKLFSAGNEKRPHYGARFILARKMSEAPVAAALTPGAGAREVTLAEAYEDHLFHGPSFQAVLNAPAVWEGGAVVKTRASGVTELLGDAGTGRWVFDPFLIDGIAQIPLLWGHALKGYFTLPLSFGRIERFTNDMSGAEKIEFRIVEETEDVIVADAILRDATGQILLKVSEMRHGIRQQASKIEGHAA